MNNSHLSWTHFGSRRSTKKRPTRPQLWLPLCREFQNGRLSDNRRLFFLRIALQRCHFFFVLLSLEPAELFFRKCVLPELFGEFFTRSKVAASDSTVVVEGDSGQCCTCKQDKGGLKIECEGRSCSIKWFQLECVGLSTKPTKKWICSECKPSSQIKKRRR